MTERESKRYSDGRELHPESLMMSYGYEPSLSEGAIKPPIFQSSTFVFKSAEDGKAFFEVAYGLREPRPGEHPGLIYSRLNNPDLEILEDRLCLWDGAEKCAVFESGMAAITTTLLELLSPGDVLLHSQPVYGGTDHFINKVLPRFGIKPVGFTADATCDELEAIIEHSVGPGRLAMIYIETPANPTNSVIDIAMCADLARRHSTEDHRAVVAVDNTYLGPVFQHPLKHGADIVLYSATKYIGGHSDVIAGAALGSKELIHRILAMRTFLGTMAGPWTGWLLLRSLETLSIRFRRQVHSANAVARFLQSHPKVTKVNYLDFLSRECHQYEVFKRQCLSAGATFSFEVKGGEPEAFRFLNSLRLVKLAVSLGGTESLAEHPATMTHADVAADVKKRLGVTSNLIRISIGLENPEDLIADLTQALERL